MKLYLNPPSPYARKVVVVAHEVGLAGDIELLKVDPWTDPPALLNATPLGKVPALVEDDGALIVESGTIAEYLRQKAGQATGPGPARLEMLRRAALAHGIMDAAFTSVIETRRPQEKRWQDWIDRQHRAITRTLPTINVPPADRFDLGDITLACTLAYLDFRMADLPWRTMHGELGNWLDRVASRPSMLASKP